MKKIIGIGALVAVLAVAGALYFVLSNLDAIVKTAIEDQGSRALGTRVEVGSVRIDLREGRGTIRDLRVANPEGFSSGDVFQLGVISVQIDAGSVTGNPVVVPEVLISGPEVNFEMNERATSNVQALLDQLQSRGGGDPEPPAGVQPSDDGEPTRIAIRSFVFEKGAMSADFTALGGVPIEAPLPAVRLTDIGGPEGAAPDELGRAVATAFLNSVLRAAARGQAEALVDKGVQEAGKAARDLLKDAFRR